MKKAAFYLVLSMLSVRGVYGNESISPQTPIPSTAEGDALIFEEEVDLEEEDLEGFEEG